MRNNRTFLALGITLAAATAFLAAGCGDQGAAPEAKTSVGTQIDDAVVTAKVKSALLADSEVKSFDFKVETRKGAVQLSGFVDNQEQVDRAIATTRSVEGVTDVQNAITLKTGKQTVGNAV